jgi:hypothetical protein
VANGLCSIGLNRWNEPLLENDIVKSNVLNILERRNDILHPVKKHRVN